MLCYVVSVISYIYSTDINWGQLTHYLGTQHQEQKKVAGDGHCFLESVRICMQQNNINMSLGEIIDVTEIQLYEQLPTYSASHVGNKRDFLRDAERYLRGKEYNQDVTDVIVAATADALKINLMIHQKMGGKMAIINHSCGFGSPRMTAKLVYNGSHYNPITPIQLSSSLSPQQIGSKAEKTSKKRSPKARREEHESQDSETQMYDIDEYSSHSDQSLEILDVTTTSLSQKNREERVNKAITGRPQPLKNQKSFLSPFVSSLPAKHITDFPHAIDGNQVLKMKQVSDPWTDQVLDGRWFKYSESSRAGFRGRRKFGRCMGSRACRNLACPKLTAEGVVNTMHFRMDRITGRPICKICEDFGVEVYCGCIKVLEFDPVTGEITIYHQGNHICRLKEDTKKKSLYIRNHLGIAQDRNPDRMRTSMMSFYLSKGQYSKAIEAAEMTIDTTLVGRIRKKNPVAGKEHLNVSEKDAFHAISDLKEAIDDDDPFLIYSKNSRTLNGKPTHVFKSSAQAAEIAIKMDTRNEEHSILQEECAYMDAMHSRCKQYKTITMWVYHPAKRDLQALAIMECQRENTENISLFLTLFNKMLSQHKGVKNYTFHPKYIMVDEAGCNRLAVKKVFGENSGIQVVGCQWHFKKCARNQLAHLPEDERRTFQVMYGDLCKTHTDTEYDRVYEMMLDILQRADRVTWLRWWDVRKYHIVPVFRGNDMPGLNLAETGHSKLARLGKNLTLMDACMSDTCMFIKQGVDYRAFLRNERSNLGCGPTQKEAFAREKKIDQKKLADYLEVIRQKKYLHEFSDNEDTFMPTRRAKHKVPKTFSSQNPSQKAVHTDRGKEQTRKRKSPVMSSSEDDEREMATQSTGRAARKRTTKKRHIETSDDGAEETEVPLALEQNKLKNNPPVLVRINRQIKSCFGCKGRFSADAFVAPNDLVFKLLAIRQRPVGDGTWVDNTFKTPAYFHSRDMACLRRVDPTLDVTYIYMTNDTYFTLGDEHIRKLKRQKYWEAIVKNRNYVSNSQLL